MLVRVHSAARLFTFFMTCSHCWSSSSSRFEFGAGVCWAGISEQRNARRGEPVGYIHSLGVVPEHRRHGQGRALLLTGMRWLRDNGQGAIELGVMGDNALALPLYRSVGYAPNRQGTDYRLYL